MTEIRLSASSIKDFITCEKMYFYRVNNADDAEDRTYFTVGKIVHSAIETYWKNQNQALDYIEDECKVYNLNGYDTNRVVGFVRTFFDNFQYLLSDEDLVEYKFKIKHSKGVYITGKYDRILPGGVLLDWKTTAKPPKDISNDIQFILYNEAYNQLYGKYPVSVLYMSLQTGKAIAYKRNEEYVNILYNEIMPSMIKRIRDGVFPHTGLLKYEYPCDKCVFKGICFSELEEKSVVESTEFTDK